MSPYKSEPKSSENPLKPDKHCHRQIGLMAAASLYDNLVALIIQGVRRIASLLGRETRKAINDQNRVLKALSRWPEVISLKKALSFD